MKGFKAMKITKFLSAAIIAIGLAASPASAATIAEQVAGAFSGNNADAFQQLIASNPGQEGALAVAILGGVKDNLESNSSLAAAAMGQLGSLFSADLPLETAQQMAAALREVVNAVKSANAQGTGSQSDNGSIIAAALTYASQPSIVAADAGLYADVLADASEFTGDDEVQKQLNFARQMGLRPNNNQQPTVIQTPD